MYGCAVGLRAWRQRLGAVQMDLRSTSKYEKPFDPPAISSWGSPSGRFFNGAAELPLGPGALRPAGSAGDLVADDPLNRIFDRALATVIS
jgi:hypothetical protein